MKKLIAFFHKCRPFDCLLESQVDSMEQIMVFFVFENIATNCTRTFLSIII